MSAPQTHPQEQEGDLTLGQLLTRSLRSADAILASPSPNDPKLQATLAATLADLSLCDKLIDHLGVLSPNESLDDLSTRNLRCLVVPALEAHLSLLVRTRGGQERLEWLDRAKAHWTRFLDQLDRYGVLDGDDERRRAAIAGPRVGDTDPARRRAGKIAQFKMEREIKATLEELRARRRTTRVRRAAVPSSSSSSSSSSAAAAAATAGAATQPEDQDDYPSSSEDEDDTTTSVARPLLVNLLTLHALRAYADLDSISHERDILEHGLKLSEIPAPGPHGAAGGRGDGRARAADGEGEGDEDEEDRWRLDVLPGRDGTGPVLSPGGKVLRPFTILPSSSSQLDTRVRLQSEVFRESWRLPTMTIDEYLAGEEAAGRVLQGGGERTTDEVDQARRDEKAEDEEDDTREGYDRVEGGLAKKREWDDYRDTHRKGEGNMHNRG